ncbi:MAG TPA: glycosyltransferase [Planctomycetaceae bacterium]|nr:glycosyltransferase [Planctomycetaceae bacterium]
MRVAVLSHALRVAGGLSAGKNLIGALSRVAPWHEYLLVVPHGAGYEEVVARFPRAAGVFYRRRFGHLGRWYYDAFRVPHIVSRFRPDIVLSLNNRGVGSSRWCQVVLCHDPHLFYAERHFSSELLRNRLIKRYHKFRLRRDLRHTAVLLCQTHVAEQRIRMLFGYRGKAVLCPNAVSRVVLDRDNACASDGRLGRFAGRWIMFCLTRYYPHKNLEVIVDLYQRFRQQLDDTVVLLTISPDQHPKAQKLLKRIERLHLSGHIVNLGPLSQEELATYFRACHALLLPTLLESFSGTYLEAMQFGLPILTSDLDFAREICGQAALYFDPWDAASLRDAVLRLKADQSLARQLVAAGRWRVQNRFRSWDEIARDLVRTLEDVAAGRLSAADEEPVPVAGARAA